MGYNCFLLYGMGKRPMTCFSSCCTSESESQEETKETVLVVCQRWSMPFSHITTSCPSRLPYLLLRSS